MPAKHRSITYSRNGILKVYPLDTAPTAPGAQPLFTYDPKVAGAGSGFATAAFTVGAAEAARLVVSPMAWNPHCPFVETFFLGQDIASDMPPGFPKPALRAACTRRHMLTMMPSCISWNEMSDAGSIDLTKFIPDQTHPDPEYIFTLIEDPTTTGVITVVLPDGNTKVLTLKSD